MSLVAVFAQMRCTGNGVRVKARIQGVGQVGAWQMYGLAVVVYRNDSVGVSVGWLAAAGRWRGLE